MDTDTDTDREETFKGGLKRDAFVAITASVIVYGCIKGFNYLKNRHHRRNMRNVVKLVPAESK